MFKSKIGKRLIILLGFAGCFAAGFYIASWNQNNTQVPTQSQTGFPENGESPTGAPSNMPGTDTSDSSNGSDTDSSSDSSITDSETTTTNA